MKVDLTPQSFQKKLPYLCIKLHGVKDRMIVYDLFMGMGTTALACISLGINYLGTEIDPGYTRVADEDIERSLSKTNMSG
jgi:site-specific DNA-methyltransferase (adenine-specific)